MWGPAGARGSTEGQRPRGPRVCLRGRTPPRCAVAGPPPLCACAGLREVRARASGHLGARHAPVCARTRFGGHRVRFPAELAGVWEVGGRRPRVEMAEPEVVPPLSEGVPDLQQAGADAALVVLAERLPLELPLRVVGEDPVVVEGGDEVVPRGAGVPLGGGCHVHVEPGVVGRQRIPLAPVRGVPVEECQ